MSNDYGYTENYRMTILRTVHTVRFTTKAESVRMSARWLKECLANVPDTARIVSIEHPDENTEAIEVTFQDEECVEPEKKGKKK